MERIKFINLTDEQKKELRFLPVQSNYEFPRTGNLSEINRKDGCPICDMMMSISKSIEVENPKIKICRVKYTPAK